MGKARNLKREDQERINQLVTETLKTREQKKNAKNASNPNSTTRTSPC